MSLFSTICRTKHIQGRCMRHTIREGGSDWQVCADQNILGRGKIRRHISLSAPKPSKSWGKKVCFLSRATYLQQLTAIQLSMLICCPTTAHLPAAANKSKGRPIAFWSRSLGPRTRYPLSWDKKRLILYNLVGGLSRTSSNVNIPDSAAACLHLRCRIRLYYGGTDGNYAEVDDQLWISLHYT